MIDVQHGALGAFKHHALALADGVVQQLCVSVTKGRTALRRLGVLIVHLDWVERVGSEKRVGNRVLLVAGLFNVRFEQACVKQVNHAQSAAMHLVLVRGTDSPAGGADLLPSREHSPPPARSCDGREELPARGWRQIAAHRR